MTGNTEMVWLIILIISSILDTQRDSPTQLEIEGVDKYAMQNDPDEMRKKQNKAIMLRR